MRQALVASITFGISHDPRPQTSPDQGRAETYGPFTLLLARLAAKGVHHAIPWSTKGADEGAKQTYRCDTLT